MPDVLIRGVPADDLARIDERAARAGLSRTEYLRRQLHQAAGGQDMPVSVDDLRLFGERVRDLGDDEVMQRAWS